MPQFILTINNERVEDKPIRVDFSLRKTLGGNIELVINNEAVNSPATLLEVTQSGVIRLKSFDNTVEPNTFMKYESFWSGTYQLYRQFAKIERE